MGKQKVITSTSFTQKPAWFNIINRSWKGSYFLGTKVKLEKDHLFKLARKQTGLQDFGIDFNEEPLDRLLESINHEAGLHPIGRFITQKRMSGLLAIRLRAENWFAKHPEVLDQPLYPVRLICGLQRTGTTKLHRLLASDPNTRALLSWEAINPLPLNGSIKEVEQRKKVARMSEKALRLMAPGFFSIHPVEYEKPEEDILLLDLTFLSTTPEATMHVPSYAAWLEQTDQSFAYAYAVKLMKFLQWQRPAKRWVLKSPHHLEFLDLATKHFGDVQLIWTHRNIHESLPSFLSMVAHSRAIFSNAVTLEQVAQHWVRKTAYMLSKGIAFRKAHPEASFTDVFYEDLVADPMGVLQDIYEGEMSAESAQVFIAADQRNAPNRFGMHEYSLDDAGLDPKDIDRTMSHYSKLLYTIRNSDE